MDFDKIKPAVEEISLSDSQTEKILEACKKTKQKKFNGKVWIPVAAAAAFAVILISPGFLFRAKSEDAAAPEAGNMAAEGALYDVYADSDAFSADVTLVMQSASSTAFLFEHDGFRRIYATVPVQFSWLVDADEFEKWKKGIDASGGMAMLQFIEHFNVSREDFNSANEAYTAFIDSTYVNGHLHGRPESPEEESREIFNADLLYTFDRAAIDEYYVADYQ